MFEGAFAESNTSGAKSGMRGAGDQWIYCHAAVLLLCFFVLTQWTCREQGAFFIGHMPLHNDLWTQALCSLILLSMHYVARPSVTLWGSRDASCTSLPLTIHTLTMGPLCTFCNFSLFLLTWTASYLKLVIVNVFNVMSLSFKALRSLKFRFKNHYIKMYPLVDCKWPQ